MHHKDIKHEIRKQLKRFYPNWQRLTKKEKKAIARQVLNEVVEKHNFTQPVNTDKAQLLGLENQAVCPGIMSIDEMAQFINNRENDVLFRLNKTRGHPAIADEELKLIDALIDDGIINEILSYDGYSPYISHN